MWWLSYVLIRDGLMVITFGLSLVFLFPNLYLKVGVPITAPLATVVLSWALFVEAVAGLRRRPRRVPGRQQPARRSRRCCTSSRRSTASRPRTRTYLGDLPSALTSTGNLALARPILWLSIALVGITSAALFARFLVRLGRPADGEETMASPELDARAA